MILLMHNGDKLTEYKEKGQEFPTLPEFLELHEGREAYELFTREFIRRIVGEKEWLGNNYRALLSEYCTASDEAYGLLCIENNYDRWTYMQESKDYKDKSGNAPPALYTNSGNSTGGRGAPKKFQGWSMVGYKRFDTLHKMVKIDRAKLGRTAFEEAMKKFFEEDLVKRNKKRREPETDSDGDEIYAAHDFDDVDVGGGSSSSSDSDSEGGSDGPAGMQEGEDGEDEQDDQQMDDEEDLHPSQSDSQDSNSETDEDDRPRLRVAV